MPGSRAAGDDVSVVLVEHSDGPSITFAHASCAGSAVIESQTPRPDHSDDIADVISQAGILPSANGPRPFLIVELRRPGGEITVAGDLIDPWLSGLLESGWSLMSSIGKRAAPVPGWDLSLDSNGEGIVTMAGRASSKPFLDPLPPLPAGWAEMVTSQGQVTVFAVRMGLAALSEATPNETFKALNRAASQGQLVAASIAVSRREPVPES
ncbi:MAG: hypothetical protein M3Z84_04460, partial [Actinomycetota bacterium]|nr:hypothetical protein [Actinomycetota bacterium]